jgi:uncharacterized membrane protein YraQ (UPF0718 family)
MNALITRPRLVPPSPAAFAGRHPARFLVAAAVAWTLAWLSLLPAAAVLGTVLAFMMGVIARSLPEMIILRKVLKVRLIAAFAGIVAAGIVLVGHVFNAVL